MYLFELWLTLGLCPGVGLLGPVVVLSFSETLHSALCSGCPSLHPPTVREHCLLPHPHQHLLLVDFQNVAILMGVRYCFIVGLICISLMISNVEHLLMFPLVICMSLEKFLLRSSAHFLIAFFDTELYQLFVYQCCLFLKCLISGPCLGHALVQFSEPCRMIFNFILNSLRQVF